MVNGSSTRLFIWALQPITFKYSNSLGQTTLKNGLTPDFYVEDQLLPALPLGSHTEPLFAKAVEQITNGTVVAMKSVSLSETLKYTVLDQLYPSNSRADKGLHWQIDMLDF